MGDGLVLPFDIAVRVEVLRIAAELLNELTIVSASTGPVIGVADWIMQDYGG